MQSNLKSKPFHIEQNKNVGSRFCRNIWLLRRKRAENGSAFTPTHKRLKSFSQEIQNSISIRR